MGISAFVLFPIWLIVFVVLLVIFLIILWIWALIDCLVTSRLTVPEKILWLILILVLNILGAILYFLLAKSTKVKMIKSKDLKGKKLLRSKRNRVMGGVCAGIGEYLGVDPTVVRLIWVVVTIFSGFFVGILAYIIAWAIIPEGK